MGKENERSSHNVGRGQLIAMVCLLRQQLIRCATLLENDGHGVGDIDLLLDRTDFEIEPDDIPLPQEITRVQEGGKGPLILAAEVDAMARAGVVFRPWKEFCGVQLRGLLADFITAIRCAEVPGPPPTFDVEVDAVASCADTNLRGRRLHIALSKVEVNRCGHALTAEQTAIIGVLRLLVEHELGYEGVRVDGRRVALFEVSSDGAKIAGHDPPQQELEDP